MMVVAVIDMKDLQCLNLHATDEQASTSTDKVVAASGARQRLPALLVFGWETSEV